MDPDHVACYAQAQVELRELFHELECNGQVSAAELQRSLVPFTAGDVKRDLLGLLAELKSKRQSLDEADFLRVMWRKMYLASAIDATKGSTAGQHKPINVSLAHVIVSVKRRQQLRQFASYYASRGISGADHLTIVHISCESIAALRRRVSVCYDVIACMFDADELQMRSRTLLSRTRSAEVRNCSQLYCLLFTKDAGNFILGCTYFGENARRDHQDEKAEYGIPKESDSDLLTGSSLYRTLSWGDRDDKGLLMVRMEEVGLRNIVAAGSSRTAFAASTGRKMHQWRALEPHRGQNSDDAGPSETSTGVRMLDTDPSGDCFGLLGGKPLLARTKTIADVGDLRQLAAGEHYFMAVSSTGGLYSWESCPNASFSSLPTAPPLGRGCAVPERVPWFFPPEKVFRVACGSNHTIALTSNGVYAWGSNIYGQLGLGAHSFPADLYTLEPACVNLPVDCTPALDVACGDTHSVVLSGSGQVLTFGCNWEGQLGIDDSRPSDKLCDVAAVGCAYEPLEVIQPETSGDKRVYLIAAGPQTTVVVSTTGQVFQWGKCVSDGIDGVCGRVSRRVPEELKAVHQNPSDSAPGPVWHSVAIADGLVMLTRHSSPDNAALGVSTV
ncbi:hypothetical protein PHYSODRAFT_529434 [Phytophthora sojae]|uniref:Uncharacterized protein n=1 Tax=Phytophthora sojae (strain P6497) TaxID=1094619 RepID=G5AB59_PHYSP|nr:hypothetical protein PHYSODRAFT_529434 [Phytophthora sojae]EGZ07204.1 hypothetical protein PHYSODRAFT_529434 [Phytophthora sojae]|eukprot:XP_009536770.1 hypothetical protein PHYSODRAFT_529434 [Phytophthora sojae]